MKIFRIVAEIAVPDCVDEKDIEGDVEGAIDTAEGCLAAEVLKCQRVDVVQVRKARKTCKRK